MTYNNILFTIENNVATITFNRPEVQNGFNVPMCQEILDAIRVVKETDEARVLVFKAEGKVFSVGGDLTEMKRAVEEDDTESLFEITHLVMEISLAMKHLPKPVVMCTDGAVAGAAFNMVLAADMCVASTNSRFIQAFVNVGINRAMQLAMTGEAVTAEKGKEYGFVYKVCEPEILERTTNRLVQRLAKGPVNSFRAMKQMMWASFFTNFEEYAELEVKIQNSLGETEDFREGVRAFAEGRRPKFQ